MTDKPVKRYHIEPVDDGGDLLTEETYAPSGDWCKSSDVAALEAENARLRRVEKAAEYIATCLMRYQERCECGGKGESVSPYPWRDGDKPEKCTKPRCVKSREAIAAYDAAKSGAGEGVK